jgi:N,N'-diacetylchitobiose transport system substrate-binding protein
LRGIKLLAAGAVLAALVVAGCGSDDDEGGSASESAAKLSGEASVWIMDPGSPALQGVIKGYATEFQQANPGT